MNFDAETIKHGLSLALQRLQDIPAHSYFVFGTLIGCGVLVSISIWAMKTYRSVKSLEQPAKHVIGYILTVLSAGLAGLDYYLTNSTNFGTFLGSAAPTVFAFATAAHQFTSTKSFKAITNTLRGWVGQKNALKAEITPEVETPVEAAPVLTQVQEINRQNNKDIFG